MKIKVPMKKSDPIRGMEVPVSRQSSFRVRRCRSKGFTKNDIINYRLPDGILVHHDSVKINDRLPEDILFHHIFGRLPTTTLVCCRSVCKAWNRIIRLPQFVRKHLNQQHHKLLVRFPDNRFYSADYEQGGVWYDLPVEVSSRHPELLGSANGLVGLSFDHSTSPNAKVLSIWNPLTGEFKLLLDPHPYIQSHETLGFAYDSNFDDYKFLRIINTDEICRMDMYSLRKNAWKLVREAPPHDSEFRHFASDEKPGVGLNGCLYWMSFEASSRPITDFLLVGLCLRDYRITVTKLPREFVSARDSSVGCVKRSSFGRGLIAMGNCLVAYVFHNPGRFMVLTSKVSEENEERKWEKLITLPFSSPDFSWVYYVLPAWFTKDGRIVLFVQGDPGREQKQYKLGLYDPSNKIIQFQNLEMYGAPVYGFGPDVVVTHTESLLSLDMFECNIKC